MSHPVSVVIPTIDSRYNFLTCRCIPSVQRAGAAQIIVVHGEGGSNEKRNAGALAATQPYLLFVDDDSEVENDILTAMIAALESKPEATFAYSNYTLNDQFKSSPEVCPGKWNADRLRRENYIDTTSMIRRSAFLGFDPAIHRFQDWDLWLTIVASGGRGVYVPRHLFSKYILDQGISAMVPEAEAREAIRRKHCL